MAKLLLTLDGSDAVLNRISKLLEPIEVVDDARTVEIGTLVRLHVKSARLQSDQILIDPEQILFSAAKHCFSSNGNDIALSAAEYLGSHGRERSRKAGGTVKRWWDLQDAAE